MGILVLRPYISAKGVITFYSAGPGQAAICANNITMTATVLGDITGHVFLWEQISGSTIGVTITSATDQPVLTYTNTGAHDDKVWRFWIDKGTLQQKSSDVGIFGTPTEQVYITSTNKMGHFNYGLTYDSRVPVLTLLIDFPTDKTSSVTTNSVNSSALQWTITGDAPLFYTLKERISGSNVWNTVVTTSNTMYTGQVNEFSAYMVFANYQEGTVIVEYPSNEIYVIYPNTTLGLNAFGVEPVFLSSSSGLTFIQSSSSITTTMLTSKPFESPSDFPNESSYLGSTVVPFVLQSVSDLVTTPLTLKSFSTPVDFTPEDVYFGVLEAPFLQTVTNYTVTPFTGSSVGG